MIRFSLAAACVLVAVGPAGAQPEHVHQACQADVASLCADIKPGEGRVMECLRAHGDQVSEGCRTAMAQTQAARRAKASADTSPPPPPSVSPPPSPP